MSLIPRTARHMVVGWADILRTAPACRFPQPHRVPACSRTFYASPPRPAQAPDPDVSEKKTVAYSRDVPLQNKNIGASRFADFDLGGKVFVVTGGAQGLGLSLAEALVEAGARGGWKSICLCTIALVPYLEASVG